VRPESPIPRRLGTIGTFRQLGTFRSFRSIRTVGTIGALDRLGTLRADRRLRHPLVPRQLWMPDAFACRKTRAGQRIREASLPVDLTVRCRGPRPVVPQLVWGMR
jgi:hypothetical protein